MNYFGIKRFFIQSFSTDLEVGYILDRSPVARITSSIQSLSMPLMQDARQILGGKEEPCLKVSSAIVAPYRKVARGSIVIAVS